MTVTSDLADDLDAKVVDVRSHERPFLIFFFVMMYVTYAALGRDVFYNHLNSVTVNDPIGLVLPFVRVAVCGAAVAVVVLSAGLTWSVSKIPLMFAPFCLWALASASWAEESKEVVRNSLVLIALWVSMPIVIHRLGLAQTVRTSLHVIAVVVIASAFMAIVFPKIGRHSGEEVVQFVHAGRWRGIFAHKNGLGPWAAYGSVFLFTHSWLCGGPRLYWWVARMSALLCLVFCGSATGVMIAFTLGFMWIFFQALRRYKLSFVVTLAVLAVLGFAVVSYFALDTLFALLGRDSSLTGRTDIWAFAVDQFWERPLTGNGYQSLGGPEFLDKLFNAFGEAVPGPENGYLDILLEVGTVGFILFFVPFFVCIRNGFEWMKYVTLEDRAGIEFYVMTLLSMLIAAIAETTSILSTSFDGVIAFAGFFALLTTPKSPDQSLKAEFRLQQHITR